MNSHRFDDFVRRMAQANSRREVFKAFAVLLLGSAVASGTRVAAASSAGCGGPGEPCCTIGVNSTTNLHGLCNAGLRCQVTSLRDFQGICVCPTGTVIINGACGPCPAGQHDCNGQCQQCCSSIDCEGKLANANATCVNGTCQFTCHAGFRMCKGECLANSQPCNGSCPAPRRLIHGACAKHCTSDSQCPCGACEHTDGRHVICTGAASQTSCGANKDCPSGSVCLTSGVCAPIC